MPRGRKTRQQPVRVPVDPAFPQTADLPDPFRPALRFGVLSYYGPQAAYRTPVEVVTFHTAVATEEEGLAYVEAARAYNPKYRNVEFALHPLGRPLVLPLRALEAHTQARRYQRENELLQQHWDAQVAEQRAERKALQTRAKEAAKGRAAELTLTGADPATGELLTDRVVGTLGGDPSKKQDAPGPAEPAAAAPAEPAPAEPEAEPEAEAE